MARLFQVSRSGERTFLFCCLLLMVSSPFCWAAAPEKPKPAELKITGYGFLGNRELRRMLRTVELGGKKPEFFGATFVEDSALILTARVKRDGYLEPRIVVRLTLEDGGHLQVTTDELLENPLPRPLRITRVEFVIHKGLLYYYERLEFEGLQSIDDTTAHSYFLETGPLFHLKKMRIYTPDRLQGGLSSLTDALDRQGYQDAKAEVDKLVRDDNTGAVEVRVRVQQGRKYIVRSVREEFFYEGAPKPEEARTIFPNRPYSKLWVQDFTLSVKTNRYHRGYPDVTVQVQTLQQHSATNTIELELLANVKSGPQVRIGKVEFQGEKRTKVWLMSRRVRVERGELLDPVRTEAGRFRLAQLGIFDSVDLSYKPETEHIRDVIYKVKEGKTRDLSLLFGWGSYELLRGGFIADQYNIWGLAHHARLKAVQSFKASSGEFTYTVPDLVDRDVDLFVNGTGLRREEISFTRVEYGGSAGLHKFLKPLATDVNIRYNYQILSALSLVPEVASEGPTNPAVSSIIADIKLDRRDNPLYPRRGYKFFTTLETATEYLGGDVNYQRIESSASWHHALGGGRWLSLGVSHGVDVSFGSSTQNLPFDRRFFPGGANSIRGYQDGEASPRNEQGQIVGAETYLLGTVEIEQALTPKWSLVLFSDSLGFARRVSNYPFDTGLFSVGGGLRWHTIIGPVRLEYGHNLNPRPLDPSGTIQFSLGFPF